MGRLPKTTSDASRTATATLTTKLGITTDAYGIATAAATKLESASDVLELSTRALILTTVTKFLGLTLNAPGTATAIQIPNCRILPHSEPRL